MITPARVAAWTVALSLLLRTPAAAQKNSHQPASPARVSQPLQVDEALAVRHFADRVPLALSPDSKLVAYTVSDPRRLAKNFTRYFGVTGTPGWQRGSDVLITDVGSGVTHSLTGGRGASWGPVWSPDGRQLAFYSDRDGFARLWLWDRARDTLRRVSDVIVRPFFGFEQVRWSPDGHNLLIKVLPEGMTLDAANHLLPLSEDAHNNEGVGGDSVTARVYSALGDSSVAAGDREDHAVVPLDQTRSFMNAALADLALVDVVTGRVRRIASRVRPMAYRFSPDGGSVLLNSRHPFNALGQIVWNLSDIKVLDTLGHTRVALPTATTQGYGLDATWSPDGRHIAYADGDALRVVASEGGAEVARFARAGTSLHHDYRAPLWLGNDTLVTYAADTLWRFPLDGSKPRPIAAPAGQQLLDLMEPSDAERLDTRRGQVLILTRDRTTKRLDLERIDLRSGAATALFALDAALAGDLPYAIDHSRDGDTVAFAAETGDRPAEVWIADGDMTSPRRITELNPAVTRLALGRSRLVQWTTTRGDTLRGALLLPSDYQPGRRYPLVVRVYGGSDLSNSVNRFGLETEAVDNLQLLATRGYAVLFPDTPLRVGTPLADLATDVMPGVDAVTALGIADPQRLAIMGHSYGGYSVLAILVQTGRFRAAVSSGGMSDLFSAYASMRPDGSATSIGWAEHDQGRMGASPWEARDRYLANSPFFFLDRVKTPVLLMHGGADPIVPVAQAEETFVGLRRLGKPVVLVEYAGETHHPGEWRLANVRDYWGRIFEWFDRYLGRPITH